MKATVENIPKKFWVVLSDKKGNPKEWHHVYGHVLNVGEYSFGLSPHTDDVLGIVIIRITELKTGTKLFDINVDFTKFVNLDTKGKLLEFYQNEVSIQIKGLIGSNPEMKAIIDARQKETETVIGPRPAIVDYDESEIYEVNEE